MTLVKKGMMAGDCMSIISETGLCATETHVKLSEKEKKTKNYQSGVDWQAVRRIFGWMDVSLEENEVIEKKGATSSWKTGRADSTERDGKGRECGTNRSKKKQKHKYIEMQKRGAIRSACNKLISGLK